MKHFVPNLLLTCLFLFGIVFSGEAISLDGFAEKPDFEILNYNTSSSAFDLGSSYLNNSELPFSMVEPVVLYAPPSGGGNPIGVPIDGAETLFIAILILSVFYFLYVFRSRCLSREKLPLKSNVMKKLFFLLLLIIPTSGFALDITLTPYDGDCAANCKIVANATGSPGPFVYSLKSDDNTINRPVQSSNVFENLAPGNYTVSVYEEGNAVPKTATIEVKTTYKYFSVTRVEVTKEYLQCEEDGKLKVTISGGKPDYTYALKSYPASYMGPKSSPSNVFTHLNSGSYTVSVKDGCNNTAFSAPVTVTSTGAPLLTKIVADSISVTDVGILASGCYEVGTVSFYGTIKIYQNKNQIGYESSFLRRLEYPVGSNNFTAWGNLTIPNFDRQVRTVKVQVQNPCTYAIVSQIVTIPADREAFDAELPLQSLSGLPTDYCTQPSLGNYYRLRVTNNSTYNCHPLNVRMYKSSDPGTDIINFTTVSGYASRAIDFPDQDIEELTEYTVIVTYPGSGYTQTFKLTTTSKTNPNYDSVTLTTANSPVSGNCDPTGIDIKVTQKNGTQVTYTILEAPEGSTDVGRTVTITGNGSEQKIWTNLLFGPYKILINYGCRTEEKPVERLSNSLIYGANVELKSSLGDCVGSSYMAQITLYSQTPTQVINKTKTGVSYINYLSYYHPSFGGSINLYRILPDGSEEFVRYWQMIGPITFNDLAPGNYVTRFTPSGCPGFRGDVKFTWLENPNKVIIDANKSGGITCPEQNSAILYVIPIQGAKQYRCKNYGAPDGSYTGWQTSNKFPNRAIGKYTVQVMGDCETIEQNLEVYDGNQQFLRIDYPVVGGKVCSGLRVAMRALPIGPVVSYKWFKNNVQIPGAFLDSLVIDDVKVSDSGTYKLIVNNGTCDLVSIAPMTVYQTPDVPTLSLINPPTECGVVPSNMKLQFDFTGTAPWSFDMNGTSLTNITANPYEISLPVPGYGETTYTISNFVDNNGNGCAASGVASLSVNLTPLVTTWTAAGAVSSWNDPVNWNPGIPGACTYVTIPGGLSHYPNISQTDNAQCDVIHFKHGGEVANTMLLSYNQAKVELELLTNRWYMLSAPLREMYSGDYFHDRSFITPLPRQNPAVYMMQFQTENPETSLPASSGSWTKPFNTLGVALNKGMGYMAWVDEGTDIQDRYTLNFPKDSTQYKMYTHSGIPFQTISLPARANHSRFIYESGNSPSIPPTDGNFTVNVTGDLAGSSKAIVGNPFMSHLDFGKLVDRNSAKINNSYQIFGGNSYETVLFTGSGILSTVHNDQRYIAPMQSFIIAKKATPVLGSLDFSMDMSTTYPGTALRSSVNEVSGLLKVDLYRKSERQSGLLLHYQEGVSNSFDISKDVLTYFNESDFDPTQNTGPAVVYSLLEGKPASIHAFGNLSSPIALGIRTIEKGLLTLKFSGLDNFSPGIQWVLEDRQTNKQCVLSSGKEYTFDNQSGNVEGRFFLRSSNDYTGMTDLSEYSIVIHADKGTLSVSSATGDPIQSLEIVGLQGQVLAKEVNLKTSQITRTLPLGQSVLIVKVQTEKTQRSEKILVK